MPLFPVPVFYLSPGEQFPTNGLPEASLVKLIGGRVLFGKDHAIRLVHRQDDEYPWRVLVPDDQDDEWEEVEQYRTYRVACQVARRLARLGAAVYQKRGTLFPKAARSLL